MSQKFDQGSRHFENNTVTGPATFKGKEEWNVVTSKVSDQAAKPDLKVTQMYATLKANFIR